MATGLTTMKTTTDVDVESIIELLFQQQPLSSSNGLSYYNYGTAGFRFKANVMDGLMVRVGILSIILLLKQAEEVVSPTSTTASTTTSIITTLSTGIMITASHNDESYNGVKLANPDGSMLVPIQEEFLTKWVNESNSEEWKQLLINEKLVFKLKNRILQSSSLSLSLSLHIGRDTRSHSFHLSNLLCLGAQTFIDYLLLSQSSQSSSQSKSNKVNIIICDHEVLTTPMLHHIVLHSNPTLYLPSYITPKPTRKGYIETYATAYIDLCVDLCVAANANADVNNANVNANVNTNQQQTVLRIDSACGVGYDAVKELENAILNTNTSLALITTLNAQNGPQDGPLNDSCGSDHVKTLFLPPTWWKQMNKDNNDNDNQNDNGNYSFPYCCSIDGDADRIVFFGQQSKNELSEFLDGDKIAILIAHVLQEKLSKTKTNSNNSNNSIAIAIPTMGIIQTAYANGAATNYVRDVLQLPVIITKTGVKHLHHAAVENFDIGIYFEANGHGTVVFSKQYEQFAIRQQQQQQLKDSFYIGLHRLINPAVGDALCDMLLVDYLLRSLGTNDNGAAAAAGSSSSSSSSSSSWTLQDWNTKLYQDLPNRMLKVKVKDRTIIKCNSNESICLQPLTVQPLLENAMNVATNGIENGRCFIRPSGTEDIVRVYAEAKTRTDADKLALIASQIVYDECNGIGERP
ncbi:putative membrane phosphoacetylglucosamine mutase [Fragilariopsis cylindrus CCMP1102]|uniref:Putative membrane phosphoacetylglucosamine mutase n=1 Tax=Fragilariopsis cylindrus CCMP1102 TaxID=635003 RepID=A0A1E7G020_9STRA|nr:putative membrane phosphoacetylglucosamine mutase [Fragilariopsis cylindrus CCMP1102]|eukprot:OEU23749.1 putative membrane phosphoacetylglucosamine mutase [Fragilariopsis cylindrus CCMP1102]